MPVASRLAARIAGPVAAGVLACSTVLAMTAPALGQPPSWSVVPSPNAGGVSLLNELDGVSCMSATACTAVGYLYRSGDVVKTLAESWNGAGWSVVPTASPPPVNGSSSYLNGVSCVSATACTAAGVYHPVGSPERTLVESSG